MRWLRTQLERLGAGTTADLRHAIRHYRHTPLTTGLMVLILALGIGTNVVLFTILHGLATMPAPGIARDASLVRIRGSERAGPATDLQARLLSWPEVEAFASRTDLFSTVAAYADETAVVVTGEVTLPVRTIYVTANYFRVLGVRPTLGTEPAAEPGVRATTVPTALIGHALWQERFGGARDVIGRTLRVNGFPVEIVGVAPPRFTGTGEGAGPTLWVPLAAYPVLQQRTAAVFGSADSLLLSAAARLQPGASLDDATRAVATLAARVAGPGREDGGATQAPGADGASPPRLTAGADVVPMLASNSRVSARADLLVSEVAAGALALLVLLITCTNVSGLLVGRAVARRREIAIRLALGASRGRLVRQLLTESVLLAFAAATLGVILIAAADRVIDATLSDIQFRVDWRSAVATSVGAVLVGILFGVSPALHALRVATGEVLKSASSGIAATRSRLQRSFVVVQIALTQPLLVGLAVVVAMMVADLGHGAPSAVPGRIAEIELDTWAGRVATAERSAGVAAAVERVAAMPGVVAAMPMQMGTIAAPLAVHAADRIAGVTRATVRQARLTAAPKGWFAAHEIPFVRGRDFHAGEYAQASDDVWRPMATDAVIIGSDLARRLWGTGDPIGRRLVMAVADRGGLPDMVVVGVVDEATAGPSDAGGPVRVYVPYAPMYTGVIARTVGPAAPMLNAMRSVVAAAAPRMPVARAQTLAEREQQERQSALRAGGAAAAGGVLALLLSAIGLYAAVSLVVGQRTREIGIRMALGAPAGRVVGALFAKGLGLGAIGLVLGLPLSVLTTRQVAASLNWPLPDAPLLGTAIGGAVLVVAAVAVWVPARRASAVDPIVALRAE